MKVNRLYVVWIKQSDGRKLREFAYTTRRALYQKSLFLATFGTSGYSVPKVHFGMKPFPFQ